MLAVLKPLRSQRSNMPQNDKAKGMLKFHDIVAGTVGASKALVADANKDLAGLRNVSVTNNLVVGTGISETTITAAQAAVLGGVTPGTVTASKAVVVDTNKDIATFRNLTLSGNLVTGSTTLSETELQKLDGVTAGTVTASKALVVDASRDIATLRNITADGTLTFSAGGAINGDSSTATASGGTATLNKMCGKVTTNSMATSPLNSFTLTINNSTVAAGDMVLATIGNFSTAGIPILINVTPASGTITCSIFNADTVTSFNGTVVVSFLVIKA